MVSHGAKSVRRNLHPPHEREEVQQLTLTQPLHQPPQHQSRHMQKLLRTNEKLNQLEGTQPHQMNYPFGRKDHNIITNPQKAMEIALLFYWFCEGTKLQGE